MSCNLYLCGKKIKTFTGAATISDIESELRNIIHLNSNDVYLLQNGKNLNKNATLLPSLDVHAELRLLGGKGGFGSMLRAIGAQIEKTTNREACRDLSGRRLRDINEEKRLKTWLDSQKNREEEMEDKQKKKIEKLQAKPKHVFKDEKYEQARTDLTQNIADSVEEGFKKAAEQSQSLKRSADDGNGKKGNGKKLKKKKMKGAMWLGDISSSTDSDDSDSDADSKRTVAKQTNAAKSASVTSSTCTSSSSADVSEDTSNASSVDK